MGLQRLLLLFSTICIWTPMAVAQADDEAMLPAFKAVALRGGYGEALASWNSSSTGHARMCTHAGEGQGWAGLRRPVLGRAARRPGLQDGGTRSADRDDCSAGVSAAQNSARRRRLGQRAARPPGRRHERVGAGTSTRRVGEIKAARRAAAVSRAATQRGMMRRRLCSGVAVHGGVRRSSAEATTIGGGSARARSAPATVTARTRSPPRPWRPRR